MTDFLHPSGSSAGMADLINATKAHALNMGALVQAFENLSTSLGSGVSSGVVAGTFTLAPSTASTIVTVSNITSASVFCGCPTPLTQNAANDMATTSYTMGSGSFTVTHANNSRTDRIFSYLIKI